ncbi:response regulator [Patescibacteria group bacterium]|nr:response regulator [Patescibacteria group bacterium]MBU1931427.1 response regulator [Patescibacteria group bacterium]
MKVLIVEDDSLLVKMYSTKLQSLGVEVVIAEDGETAVQLVKSAKPDFVLLDIMLPKLSGLDALKLIRQSAGGKKLPVIILSNLSNEKEKKEAEALQVKDYLVKADHTPSQVVAKIQQHLKLT